MNKDFTASNDYEIGKAAGGRLKVWDDPGGYKLLEENEVIALAEYFLSERDKELGLWRHHEREACVVKPDRLDPDRVTVVNERTMQSVTYHRGHVYSDWPVYAQVATDYFDAHPEVKPWHDAKAGEVWVLDYREVRERIASNVCIVDGVLVFRNFFGTHYIADPKITYAERVWPRSDDDQA